MPPRAARLSGHGGGRRRRRGGGGHGGGEEGGAERWLVTYADMLTLLLVLFIVLFSMSVVNTSKFEALKQSLHSAFGVGSQNILEGGNGLNDSASNTGSDVVMAQDITGKSDFQGLTPVQVPQVKTDYTKAVANELNNYEQIKKSINAALAKQHMTGDLKFNVDARGLVITVVTDDLLFPGNSADLLANGQKLLSVIGPPLKNYKNAIEVDGYTNQEKVSTYPFIDGWELSSDRAAAVVRWLSHDGLPESRLSAVGMNDKNPLYPPSDPRAKTYNRRVEIVVLSTLPSDAGDALAKAASSTAKPSN
jgi:chemotaxis protein MotB